MVNLVKARQKAKKREAEAGSREPGAGGREPEAGSPELIVDKLAKFKDDAGQRRAAPAAASATATVASASTDLELLTFIIDGERYAIDVERVIEIATPRPLTRVPNADAFVRGVMSLRGVVVTMVDVRTRLRHPRKAEGEQVIVITDRGNHIGFDVDRVLRPVKIGRDAVEPHPVVHASEERPAIRGVFRQANALTILLDLDKLLC